jgi:hypothetical protein
MEEVRNIFRILVRKPEAKRCFAKLKHRIEIFKCVRDKQGMAI